ncbi:MAG: hypothetical protein ACO3A2_07060 [Bdellovibrionia bacterium]
MNQSKGSSHIKVVGGTQDSPSSSSEDSARFTEKKRVFEDLHQVGSKEAGLKRVFELVLRRFKMATQLLAVLVLFLAAAFIFALALQPAVFFFRLVDEFSQEFSWGMRSFSLGFALAIGFFLYGFTMILLVPGVNFLLGCRLKPWRGIYHSFETLRWFVHNGLTYLARYTFLELFTPTPFAVLFYRLMGMKIGRDTQLNSTHISDPSLIELGERVTIGGSATLIAHSGAKGFLIIAPVKIGDGAVIGIKATVMAGVSIGAHAKVLPHSVVMPHTVIPEGETWAGIPAVKVSSSPQK